MSQRLTLQGFRLPRRDVKPDVLDRKERVGEKEDSDGRSEGRETLRGNVEARAPTHNVQFSQNSQSSQGTQGSTIYKGFAAGLGARKVCDKSLSMRDGNPPPDHPQELICQKPAKIQARSLPLNRSHTTNVSIPKPTRVDTQSHTFTQAQARARGEGHTASAQTQAQTRYGALINKVPPPSRKLKCFAGEKSTTIEATGANAKAKAKAQAKAEFPKAKGEPFAAQQKLPAYRILAVDATRNPRAPPTWASGTQHAQPARPTHFTQPSQATHSSGQAPCKDRASRRAPANLFAAPLQPMREARLAVRPISGNEGFGRSDADEDGEFALTKAATLQFPAAPVVSKQRDVTFKAVPQTQPSRLQRAPFGRHPLLGQRRGKLEVEGVARGSRKQRETSTVALSWRVPAAGSKLRDQIEARSHAQAQIETKSTQIQIQKQMRLQPQNSFTKIRLTGFAERQTQSRFEVNATCLSVPSSSPETETKATTATDMLVETHTGFPNLASIDHLFANPILVNNNSVDHESDLDPAVESAFEADAERAQVGLVLRGPVGLVLGGPPGTPPASARPPVATATTTSTPQATATTPSTTPYAVAGSTPVRFCPPNGQAPWRPGHTLNGSLSVAPHGLCQNLTSTFGRRVSRSLPQSPATVRRSVSQIFHDALSPSSDSTGDRGTGARAAANRSPPSPACTPIFSPTTSSIHSASLSPPLALYTTAGEPLDKFGSYIDRRGPPHTALSGAELQTLKCVDSGLGDAEGAYIVLDGVAATDTSISRPEWPENKQIADGHSSGKGGSAADDKTGDGSPLRNGVGEERPEARVVGVVGVVGEVGVVGKGSESTCESKLLGGRLKVEDQEFREELNHTSKALKQGLEEVVDQDQGRASPVSSHAPSSARPTPHPSPLGTSFSPVCPSLITEANDLPEECVALPDTHMESPATAAFSTGLCSSAHSLHSGRSNVYRRSEARGLQLSFSQSLFRLHSSILRCSAPRSSAHRYSAYRSSAYRSSAHRPHQLSLKSIGPPKRPRLSIACDQILATALLSDSPSLYEKIAHEFDATSLIFLTTATAGATTGAATGATTGVTTGVTTGATATKIEAAYRGKQMSPLVVLGPSAFSADGGACQTNLQALPLIVICCKLGCRRLASRLLARDRFRGLEVLKDYEGRSALHHIFASPPNLKPHDSGSRKGQEDSKERNVFTSPLSPSPSPSTRSAVEPDPASAGIVSQPPNSCVCAKAVDGDSERATAGEREGRATRSQLQEETPGCRFGGFEGFASTQDYHSDVPSPPSMSTARLSLFTPRPYHVFPFYGGRELGRECGRASGVTGVTGIAGATGGTGITEVTGVNLASSAAQVYSAAQDVHVGICRRRLPFCAERPEDLAACVQWLCDLRCCLGEARDGLGFRASDYARAWLAAANLEIGDCSLSHGQRLAASAVKNAALTLLTSEDGLRLSLLAPLINPQIISHEHASRSSFSIPFTIPSETEESRGRGRKERETLLKQGGERKGGRRHCKGQPPVCERQKTLAKILHAKGAGVGNPETDFVAAFVRFARERPVDGGALQVFRMLGAPLQSGGL